MPLNHNNEGTATYIPEFDGATGPWFRLIVGLAARGNLVTIAATFLAETCRGISEVIEAVDAPLAQVLDDLGLPRLAPEDSFWRGQILLLLQDRIRQTKRPGRAYDRGNIFEKVKAAVAVEDLASRFMDLVPSGHGRLKGALRVAAYTSDKSPRQGLGAGTAGVLLTQLDARSAGGSCRWRTQPASASGLHQAFEMELNLPLNVPKQTPAV